MVDNASPSRHTAAMRWLHAEADTSLMLIALWLGHEHALAQKSKTNAQFRPNVVETLF